MIVALLVLILLALLFPGFMRMVALGLLLIVGLAAAHVARAQDAPFPFFDPEAACNYRFRTSNLAFNRCIDTEQTTYDLLKQRWDDLSAATKRQVSDFIVKLHTDNNPYVYQNAYDLAGILTEQENIRREMTAPKRSFVP